MQNYGQINKEASDNNFTFEKSDSTNLFTSRCLMDLLCGKRMLRTSLSAEAFFKF
jgi:hypothetical protein